MHRKISLNNETIKKVSLISSITGVDVMDCIRDDEFQREIVIVPKGEIYKIVGRGGKLIRKLKKVMNINIEINEYSDNIEEFIRNILFPARVKAIRKLNQSNSVIVEVNYEDKGIAIGKKGRKIKKMRLLLKRYFGVKNVRIT